MTDRRPLIETIPDHILTLVADQLVCQVGFGAGPSFVAKCIEDRDPAVPLEEAILWLERYRGSFKMGHIEMTTGDRLFFSPLGFKHFRPKLVAVE